MLSFYDENSCAAGRPSAGSVCLSFPNFATAYRVRGVNLYLYSCLTRRFQLNSYVATWLLLSWAS